MYPSRYGIWWNASIISRIKRGHFGYLQPSLDPIGTNFSTGWYSWVFRLWSPSLQFWIKKSLFMKPMNYCILSICWIRTFRTQINLTRKLQSWCRMDVFWWTTDSGFGFCKRIIEYWILYNNIEYFIREKFLNYWDFFLFYINTVINTVV